MVILRANVLGRVSPWDGSANRVAVLDEDVGLRNVLAGEDGRQARLASLARLEKVPTGCWTISDQHEAAAGGFGLLALSGALLRTTGVDRRLSGELIGPGDLLLTEHDEETSGTVPCETAWSVISPVSLAVLDRRWAERMSAFPAVSIELSRRSLQRSQRLATMLAIAQQPRLEMRLWLLFWELADRFGVVRRDGVHLALPLTHSTLSHLVAARRPSVSAAIGRLAAHGVLSRDGRNWRLHGDAPIPERPSEYDGLLELG